MRAIEASTHEYIAIRHLPCENEFQRMQMALVSGYTYPLQVTRDCFVEFYCMKCGHTFDVIGRSVLERRFRCPAKWCTQA